MKKTYWLLPLFLVACKNDKPQQSTIFGSDNEEESVYQEEPAPSAIPQEDAAAEQEKIQFTDEQYIDLELPDAMGNMKSLSSYVKKNKVTLINCWANWCRPSIDEMPQLAQLYRKYHSLGLEMVGVSFDSDPRSWEVSVKIHDMVWPQFCEMMGRNNQVSRAYGVKDLPYTILIDRKGKILARGLHGEKLTNAVAKAIRR